MTGWSAQWAAAWGYVNEWALIVFLATFGGVGLRWITRPFLNWFDVASHIVASLIIAFTFAPPVAQFVERLTNTSETLAAVCLVIGYCGHGVVAPARDFIRNRVNRL